MSEINVAAPAREASLWSTVRESIAGSHRGEYTDGPIGRAILLLAIPMVLELVLESVFAVVDVFFVSRLGADAVATVGLTESILTIVYALAIGLSVGAMATVARRIGERDRDGAARAAVQAIVLGVVVAVPIGLIASRSARRLLTIMGATPDVLAHSSYAAIVLGFNGVIVMLFLINAVFRGAGDAAIAMRVLWIANAINICLDPCFIFGLGPCPRLAVTGAAVATATARGVRVARVPVQLGGPRNDQPGVHRVGRGRGRAVHERPGGCADRRPRPAHHQWRLRVLRLRVRAVAVVQRRRRHRHADADQPLLLLARLSAARLPARARPRSGAAGRVLGDRHRVFGDDARERLAVSVRIVEAEARLEPM